MIATRDERISGGRKTRRIVPLWNPGKVVVASPRSIRITFDSLILHQQPYHHKLSRVPLAPKVKSFSLVAFMIAGDGDGRPCPFSRVKASMSVDLDFSAIL